MKPTAPVIAPEGGCIRLACCIPFCRRTFRNDKKETPWPAGSEVMCGKHWRLVSAARRRRYNRLRRLFENKKGKLQGPLAERIARLLWQEFEHFKTIATGSAAGIG